jgi:hypothetical protein
MKLLTVESLRLALNAMNGAGLRVHHIELGPLAWMRLHDELVAVCDMRDDVGYGSHPATLDMPAVRMPVLDGVVLAPNGIIPAIDQWAIVFGNGSDAAIDYKLSPEHRAMYEKARLADPCPSAGRLRRHREPTSAERAMGEGAHLSTDGVCHVCRHVGCVCP